MAKKTLAIKKARLCRTSTRWYIDFTRYNAETGRETRHRQDFDLNEISDLQIRELVAHRLIRYLDVFAPPVEDPGHQGPVHTLRDAVAYAVGVKTSGPRKNTHKGYKSIGKKVFAFADAKKLSDMPVGEFGRKHARMFFDELTAGGRLSGTTINNCLIHLRSLWSEMMDREMVQANPWKLIKPVRMGEKTRRVFTPEERRTVAAYIEANDYWMFRALLLQFYLYIRPVEQSRLRFKNFDFARGLVHVEGYQSKTWKPRWVTIPAQILHYFTDGRFDKYPANLYVFGAQVSGKGETTMEPSNIPASENRMYKRHQKILEKLRDRGELGNILGLTWYSWKDTGISQHVHKTSLIGTRDQAGHIEVAQTITYYHSDQVNSEYKDLKHDLYE